MTTKLAEVAAAYGELTAEQVEVLTTRCTHLIPELLRARTMISEEFTDSARTSLTTMSFMAMRYFCILIHTDLARAEAMHKEKALLAKWKLSRVLYLELPFMVDATQSIRN